MNQFKNTIEVFKKITEKAKSKEIPGVLFENYVGKEFLVSQKQLNWLFDVYYKEASKNINHIDGISITVTDQTGSYTFSYNKKVWNVPHYIPNREKYGLMYKIFFYPNY